MTTAQNLEIFPSPWRMLSLFTGTAGAAVPGYLLATGAMGGVSTGRQAIGYTAMLVFGVASLFILRQWFFNARPVVTLTESGITDARIAKQEIPWRAITNLALWQQGRQKSLVLSIEPDVEAGLTLTRLARWTREPNKGLGVDGLCIAGDGLKLDFPTLAEEIAARYRAARANVETANLPGA